MRNGVWSSMATERQLSMDTFVGSSEVSTEAFVPIRHHPSD